MRIFGDNFFYSNLRIQEGLTGIRYGIEARRGLIIITGVAGGGKTTLLSRAVAEMPPHIFCVAMSGKALQLRDVLRQLNATESVDDDEAALVRGCQSLLRSRLGRNELTALAIDDAHCLPERTLRGLIHNFFRRQRRISGRRAASIDPGRECSVKIQAFAGGVDSAPTAPTRDLRSGPAHQPGGRNVHSGRAALCGPAHRNVRQSSGETHRSVDSGKPANHRALM